MMDPATIATIVSTASTAVGATMTLCQIAEKIGLFESEPKAEAPNPLARIGFMVGKLPFFDGSDYEIWSAKMKSLLVSQGLWDFVEGGYREKRLNAKALRDDQMKDATALFIIQDALDKSVFHCILNANKSKDAWDALQKNYQVNTGVGVASMVNNFGEQIGIFNTETKVEDNYAEIRIQLFNGSGYEIWSTKMKALFLSQDLWDSVQGGYAERELTSEALQDVRIKDAMAMILILQAVDKSVFSCIANATKSKDAWDALQKEYQGNTYTDEPYQNKSMDELQKEDQGNTCTEESNQEKSRDEFLFPFIANARQSIEAYWDALPKVFQVNTNVLYVDYKGVVHFMFKSS